VETYQVTQWLSNTGLAVTKMVTLTHEGGRTMQPGLGQQEMSGMKTILSSVDIFFLRKKFEMRDRMVLIRTTAYFPITQREL
jgi:hypothetical protein